MISSNAVFGWVRVTDFPRTQSRSGEIDVVAKAGLSRTIEQSKQRGALVSARSPTNDNNYAVMWLRCRESQKIVPVASQKYGAGVVRKPKNSLVRRIPRKRCAQQCDIMSELLQQVTQVIGHVMIEQELHSGAGAICLATSRSISPR